MLKMWQNFHVHRSSSRQSTGNHVYLEIHIRANFYEELLLQILGYIAIACAKYDRIRGIFCTNLDAIRNIKSVQICKVFYD